jgi:hypothetical protein
MGICSSGGAVAEVSCFMEMAGKEREDSAVEIKSETSKRSSYRHEEMVGA